MRLGLLAAEIKLLAATFLSGAAEALTEKQQTVFGPVSSPTLNDSPFEVAQKVLLVYAQRIYETMRRITHYERQSTRTRVKFVARNYHFGLLWWSLFSNRRNWIAKTICEACVANLNRRNSVRRVKYN
jgi:hypothetical protein